jgi:hypothetical protein
MVLFTTTLQVVLVYFRLRPGMLLFWDLRVSSLTAALTQAYYSPVVALAINFKALVLI